MEAIITAACDRYGHMVALFLVIDPFFFVVMDISSSTIGTNRNRPIRFSWNPES
jgi:hypothetical protein